MDRASVCFVSQKQGILTKDQGVADPSEAMDLQLPGYGMCYHTAATSELEGECLLSR